MLKRLEQESLNADLTSVEMLLERRTEDEDPVGWFQFSRRKAQLERQLAELSQQAATSSIAMLFGGRPVIGSRGIFADFSAAVISGMQSLISAQAASAEGTLGGRGPLPQRDRSQVLVTGVARGSFGFIIEDSNPSLGDIVGPMSEVCDLLARVGSPDSERFDSATDDVDTRVLVPLKQFFKTLDDSSATARIVSDTVDLNLSREVIARARERIESLVVSEPYPLSLIGRIFTMPDSKRFELFLSGSPVIKGRISSEFVKQMFADDFIASEDFNGKIMKVGLSVKETRLRNAEPRKSYQLLSVSPQ